MWTMGNRMKHLKWDDGVSIWRPNQIQSSSNVTTSWQDKNVHIIIIIIHKDQQ